MSVDLTKTEFSVSVVAKLFFDQTAWWLRYQDRKGLLVDSEGNPFGTRKDNRNGNGDRRYTLLDIEKMAWMFYHHGLIDTDGWNNCKQRVEAMYRPVYRRKKRR